MNKNKIYIKNLLFILNINKDTSLITSHILFTLIRYKNCINLKILKIICHFKFYDIQLIKNILFLRNKRIGVSDKDFQKLFYYKNNNSIINFNVKKDNGDYPLLLAIKNENIEVAQSIITYAKDNHYILEIEEKNNDGDYPLLYATMKNNLKFTQLLINYAKENSITLKLNEKNRRGNYPLLCSLLNSIDIFRLLINYAEKKNIILDLNRKNDFYSNPITHAIYNNTVEMVEILFNYAKKK